MKAAVVTLLAVGLLPLVAWAQEGKVELNTITGVQVSGGTVQIVGSKKPNFTTFTMSDPPRLVIDISEAVFSGVQDEIAVSNGVITGIRTASYGSDESAIARVLIGFERDWETDLQASGTSLVVRVMTGGAAPVAQAQPAPAEGTPGGQGTAVVSPADRTQQERAAADSATAAQTDRTQQERAATDANAAAQADRERQEREAAAAAKARADEDARQAQARADADRKAQEEAARVAAAQAEKERRDQERVVAAAAAEEQKRQQAEARTAAEEQKRQQAADARAAAEERTRQAAEARERQQAEARAAVEERKRQEAEARTRREEEAQAAADAKRVAREDARARAAEEKAQRAAEARATAETRQQPRVAQAGPPQGEPVSVSSRRKTLMLVGFRQESDASRVFIRTNEPVRYNVLNEGDRMLVLELENTRISESNNTLPLDTSFFDTAVAQVDPSAGPSSSVRVSIRLKQAVTYQMRQQGNELSIEFPRPTRR
jgi:hypothetical protein